MANPKKEHPKEKSNLHPRNKHRERYDFDQLRTTCPELAPFVKTNVYDDESIDFFDPAAVRMVNTALLKHHYGISYWEIPANYLCPPVPGRADYIHHMADLLSGTRERSPAERPIRCLDVGVGANCIYPIIGNREYGWLFVGSDTDPVAIDSSKRIVENNPVLTGQIDLRLQPDPKNIFDGIVAQGEYFDLTVCNPPFHASQAEALTGSIRKLIHLKQKRVNQPILNFGGQSNELWCEGGEARFIANMIHQSKRYAEACGWFSSLVSKSTHLKGIYKALETAGVAEIKTIGLGQGNKMSRIVAWSFIPSPKKAPVLRRSITG